MKEHVLVTGASGLFGKLFVEGLLKEGYGVLFTSRSAEKVARLEGEWSGSQGFALDLAESGAASKLRRDIEQANKMPVGVIHAARSLDYLKLEANGWPNRENWQQAFLLEVVVAQELAVAFAEPADTPLRSFVNIASMYGVVPMNPSVYEDPAADRPSHYGVVKAALIHLTKDLAVRYGKRGIRFNSISYGGLEGRVDEAFKERYGRLSPSGRMLKPNEIAEPALSLLRDGSSGINGHNLVVDGGWTTW